MKRRYELTNKKLDKHQLVYLIVGNDGSGAEQLLKAMSETEYGRQPVSICPAGDSVHYVLRASLPFEGPTVPSPMPQ